MWPVLQLGPWQVNTYLVFAAVGLVVAAQYALSRALTLGYSLEIVALGVMLTVAGAFSGVIVLQALVNAARLALIGPLAPVEGLSIIGGLLGGAVALIPYARHHRASLAQVADQFLGYLKTLEEVSLGDLANFLVVASRLALIKSRALLPFLQLAPEEEGDVEALQKQLREYQRYRDLARGIHKLDIKRAIFYSRSAYQDLEPIFYFPGGLAAGRLSQALEDLLNTITLPQRIPQAQAKDVVSLEQKLIELSRWLRQRLQARLSELLSSPSPEEKVVVFLGALELVRLNKVQALQKKNFEEITLVWQMTN